MKLRKPNKNEFDTYLNLESIFFKYHKPYNTLLQDISPEKRNLKKEFDELIKERNSFFRLVDVDGEVAGYIYGLIEKVGPNEKGWKKKGDLNSIVVVPKYRNKGIAKYMVNQFISWLKEKKVPYLETSCNVKNETMKKFNKNLGFKEQHIKFGKIIK
ncbi:GNAT family N-acetyltransferase [Candidatus Woesearchaeota archaeon]|nr:GNAT family N-acetyltransferase [Candidatus Woesearchaeota archaeon]